MTSTRVDEQWDPLGDNPGSPYNVVNGGPCANVFDYFTELKAWAAHAKRLRYTVEFVAPLFNSDRVNDYLGQLESMQETLGAANDAVNAQRMIASLATPEAFRAFARGWFLGRVGDPSIAR
jgi:hypothetical protein